MSTGASSGIDWGAMVDTLVNQKREQYAPLTKQKEILNLKIGLFKEMSGSFKKVQKSVESLTMPSLYKAKTADIAVYSPPGLEPGAILTATPTTEAALQNWDIDVLQLAKSEQRISTRVANRSEKLDLEGSFYINVGGARAKIEVEKGDSLLSLNHKLATAKDMVTGKPIGVQAQLIDNRIVLSSTETGLGEVVSPEVSAFRGEFVPGTGGTDKLIIPPRTSHTVDSSGTLIVGDPISKAMPASVTLYDSSGGIVNKSTYDYDATTGELTWSTPPAAGTRFEVAWNYPPAVEKITVKETSTDYVSGVDFTYNRADGTITWLPGGNHPDEGAEYTVHFSDTITISGDGTSTTTNISAYAPPGGFVPGALLEIKGPSNTYVEGTDFTFNRATGIIDWTGGTSSQVTEPAEELAIQMPEGKNFAFYTNPFTLEKATTGDDILGFLKLDATEEGEHWVKARNAKLTMNGITVSRASNTIEDLIGNTKLELKGVGHVGVNISLDTEKAVKAIEKFVSSYNEAMDWINVRLTEEQKVKPKSDDWQRSKDFDKKFGLLHGDSTLWQTKNRLRQLVSDPIETLGPISMLSQLGITTEGNKDDPKLGQTGKLVFDKSKFMDTLTPGKVPFFDQWMTDGLSSATKPFSEVRESMVPGTFSVSAGGKTTTIQVTKEDSLESLARKINAARADGIPTGAFDYERHLPLKAKVVNKTLAILSDDIDEKLLIQDPDGVLKSLGLDVTNPEDSAHHVQGTEDFVAEILPKSMKQLDYYIKGLLSASSVNVGNETVVKGRVASEIKSMQSEIDYIDKRIAQYEHNITLMQTRLWKQYAAAERSISIYNARLQAMRQSFAQMTDGRKQDA